VIAANPQEETEAKCFTFELLYQSTLARADPSERALDPPTT